MVQVAHPEPEPLAVGLLVGWVASGFVNVDATDQEGRKQKGADVDDEGEGRCQDADEGPGKWWARDEGGRAGGGQEGVGLQVLLPWDQLRKERGIGGVVEHASESADDGRDVEHRHREPVDGVCEGDGGDGCGLDQVCDDQHALLAAESVHPGAHEQREEVRQPDGGHKSPDLDRTGVQDGHGNQRERQLGDPIADLRDRLTGPVEPKPRVTPDHGRPGSGHAGPSGIV